MEILRVNKVFGLLIVMLFLCFFPETQAQCAMCKAQAVTGLQGDSPDPMGLNMAIMYLFFTPYLIIGVIAYFLYKNRVKP
tara:strand:- start:1718 stop:1957 length:240 start_codon:yes stop_codon:yes gene_type:complete